MKFQALAVFVFFMVYAVIRYHLFKGEPWIHLPLYTLNKAIALSSLSYIAMALFRGLRIKLAPPPEAERGQKRLEAKRLGELGAVLAIWHSLGSLTVLSPAYFKNLYTEAGRLNLAGEGTVSSGVTALMTLLILLVPWPQGGEPGTRTRWVIPCLFLVALHAFSMGIYNWIQPKAWPGGMPPLSMIASSIALATAGRYWLKK